jgi:RNA polymerase primary sigma factor
MSAALQDFFKSVGKTRLLTREEEVELAKRIEKGDSRARDRMIRANIRLAISIAKKYSNKGCSLEDLIQESFLGLIKAVDRFDWTKGFKFSTYACWWIKQSVRQHIASHSGSIKLPSYAKSALWKMQQIKIEYEKEFGITPSMGEIAELLGSTLPTLRSLVDCSSNTINLDSSAYKNDDSNRNMHEVLVDNSIENIDNSLDRVKLVNVIKDALGDLTPREEIVLRLRFGISEDEIYEARSTKGVN